MLYRQLGKTGMRVSAIGCGAMRFADIDNRDACCEMLQTAADAGINYFDTSHGYFSGKSEERLGEALARREVLFSTKSNKASGAELRRELEISLRRLRRDYIDVFHIWCVMSLEAYQTRKDGGAIEAALRARDEGLVRAVFVSTHMPGPDIARMLQDGFFNGVTLGFSPVNSVLRRDGIVAASDAGLAVVCMNPLGGGLIPRNPDYFDFLRRSGDRTVIEAALSYVLSMKGVSVALVGFSNAAQVREALPAVQPFRPWTTDAMARIWEKLPPELERLCTSCGYCRPCPAGVPIPEFMMIYDLKTLGEPDTLLSSRMENLRNKLSVNAADCTQCGQCEERCTQHLPIRRRLAYLAGLKLSPPKGTD